MPRLRILAASALLAAAPFTMMPSAFAQADNAANNSARNLGPSLTLDAEASLRVPEDTAWAMFSVEKESRDQAQAQQAGKTALAEVMAIIKKSPALQANTENLYTSPTYNKDGKISNWRTNFSVRIESTDTALVAQTISALMEKARLSGSGFRLSDAARQKAQDQLIGDAVKAFDAKAKVTAHAMGFARYEYGSINLNQSGSTQPMMHTNRNYSMAVSKVASDASDPVSLEPGNATVSVTLSGTVKLVK